MMNYLFAVEVLFFFALWGFFLVRRHLLIILIAAELVLLSISLNFLVLSAFLDDFWGQLAVLMMLTLAAAESAVGLSVLLVFYRLRGTVYINFISLLKG